MIPLVIKCRRVCKNILFSFFFIYLCKTQSIYSISLSSYFFFFNMSLRFHFFSSVMLDSFTRRMLLPDIRSMANEPPLLLWSLLFLCFLPTQLSDFSRFLPFTSRLVISIFLFQKGRGEEDWDLWKKLNYYYPYFTNRRAKLDKARR